MKGSTITYKKKMTGYAGGVNCNAVVLDTVLTDRDVYGKHLVVTAYLIKDDQKEIAVIYPDQVIGVK